MVISRVIRRAGDRGAKGGLWGVLEGLWCCECSRGYRGGMQGVARAGEQGYGASERLREGCGVDEGGGGGGRGVAASNAWPGREEGGWRIDGDLPGGGEVGAGKQRRARRRGNGVVQREITRRVTVGGSMGRWGACVVSSEGLVNRGETL